MEDFTCVEGSALYGKLGSDEGGFQFGIKEVFSVESISNVVYDVCI